MNVRNPNVRKIGIKRILIYIKRSSLLSCSKSERSVIFCSVFGRYKTSDNRTNLFGFQTLLVPNKNCNRTDLFCPKSELFGFRTLTVQWNTKIRTRSDFGQTTFVREQLVQTSKIRTNLSEIRTHYDFFSLA